MRALVLFTGGTAVALLGLFELSHIGGWLAVTALGMLAATVGVVIGSEASES